MLHTYRCILLDQAFLIGEIDIAGVLLFRVYPSISDRDTFQVNLICRCRVDNRACYIISPGHDHLGLTYQSRGCTGQQRIHQRDKSEASVVTYPNVGITHVLGLELGEDMIEVIQELDKVLRALYISSNPPATVGHFT